MAEPKATTSKVKRKLPSPAVKAEVGRAATAAQRGQSRGKPAPNDPPWSPPKRVSRTKDGKIVGGETAPRLGPTGTRHYGRNAEPRPPKQKPGGPILSERAMYGQDRPKKKPKPALTGKAKLKATQVALSHKKGLTLRRFGKEGVPLAMGPGDRYEDGTKKTGQPRGGR